MYVFVGKLYHVKHYSDESTSMQHSILYLTNACHDGADEKELTLFLSSPLDGSKIRKSWKANVIKEVVQLNAVIKLVFCPACCKSVAGQVGFEFILFVPSNNATECLEFVCQNPCFTLASSNERTISYKNIEHDKVCSQTSQNNEVPMVTSTFSSSHEDSDNNVTDTESNKVKDEHELHQPEHQDVTEQATDESHKDPVTETCDVPVEATLSGSSETCSAPVETTQSESYHESSKTNDALKEGTSTTQSGSSEITVSLPAERASVHIYEQIPDESHGACETDDENSAVSTPGTLHRSLVKPIGENIPTLKLLPPRGTHNDKISHMTTKNPGIAYICTYVHIVLHLEVSCCIHKT